MGFSTIWVHAITVGVPIQILGATIRRFGAGTTFLGEVAPEICSKFASFEYFYSRSSPTHPAWSIFKQSSEIPVPKPSRTKLGQIVFPTPYYMLRWELLLSELLTCKSCFEIERCKMYLRLPHVVLTWLKKVPAVSAGYRIILRPTWLYPRS